MTHLTRILVVGAGTPNADMVAEVLNANGFQAEWTDKVRYPDPFQLRRFDIVYGIYLQTCSRYIIVAKLLRKKTIVHFVGSDAYWFAREQSKIRRAYWRIVLHLTDLVFYVSQHLEALVLAKGFVLPFPISSLAFSYPELRNIQPNRDVLYYCPSGERNVEIYRLSWIIDYARSHPDEQITIVGNSTHPANYDLKLANVDVIPFVKNADMPAFYRHHRRLIRMTTEDGLPRMLHEALLCGLQVVFNCEAVETIPKERDPAEFSKTFWNTLTRSWRSSSANRQGTI